MGLDCYNARRAGTKDETRKSRLIHGPFLRGNKGGSAPPFRPSVASIVPDLFLSSPPGADWVGASLAIANLHKGLRLAQEIVQLADSKAFISPALNLVFSTFVKTLSLAIFIQSSAVLIRGSLILARLFNFSWCGV